MQDGIEVEVEVENEQMSMQYSLRKRGDGMDG
jgi:hypothetical protein